MCRTLDQLYEMHLRREAGPDEVASSIATRLLSNVARSHIDAEDFAAATQDCERQVAVAMQESAVCDLPPSAVLTAMTRMAAAYLRGGCVDRAAVDTWCDDLLEESRDPKHLRFLTEALSRQA